LYIKAGLKNVGTVFLLTDAQVPDEKFLVLINDLLASGEIPDLFAEDELEGVINGVRNEVKGAGLQDTKENCWSFFIDRVRRQLKVKVFLGVFIQFYYPVCTTAGKVIMFHECMQAGATTDWQV